MTNSQAVAAHYSIKGILDTIESGLKQVGADRDSVTIDQLSLVDEFHIGGRKATEHFFPQLGFRPGDRVLDIGCGIGGGSRFAAAKYEVNVDGIDLTDEYIEVGDELNRWVGMETSVSLKTGDATSLEFEDKTFDAAFTMHVCMNIADKRRVFEEAYRVIKPRGVLGIYDVTKYGAGEIMYPLPWAASAETSHLSSAGQYVKDLESAGFQVETVTDRHAFAVEFFEAVKAKMASAGGPPPLGIHVLMGSDAKTKVTNLTSNLINGLVAPFEFVARKL
ncbi:MAG: class I SAM-dependent methyltransferase [Pyrinomonadaceae bacterium]|nr:class I SAM-dependent methyltransferase [Pyrinomonadaceae bacterium]